MWCPLEIAPWRSPAHGVVLAFWVPVTIRPIRDRCHRYQHTKRASANQIGLQQSANHRFTRMNTDGSRAASVSIGVYPWFQLSAPIDLAKIRQFDVGEGTDLIEATVRQSDVATDYEAAREHRKRDDRSTTIAASDHERIERQTSASLSEEGRRRRPFIHAHHGQQSTPERPR
jgi:hypothetical protein